MNNVFLSPSLIHDAAKKIYWQGLFGSSKSLSVAANTHLKKNITLIITKDIASAHQLATELNYFIKDRMVCPFPDWETLPYDHFSPHKDIISERLFVLNQILKTDRAIVIAAVTTLLHPLPPKKYLLTHSLSLAVRQKLHVDHFRKNLDDCGYHHVDNVMEHGEYAIRGSIIDLFPMGTKQPYRIDLFDNEIDTIRSFDPETQRSIEKIESINLLPALEFPFDEKGIDQFRINFRKHFSNNPFHCPLYQDITHGLLTPGIEYYLPLFFEKTETLMDYLPNDTLIIHHSSLNESIKIFWKDVHHRYDQLQHDIDKPILSPRDFFLAENHFNEKIKSFEQIKILDQETLDEKNTFSFHTKSLPDLSIRHQLKKPLALLETFIQDHSDTPILFVAESLGRREALLNLLNTSKIYPTTIENFTDFTQEKNLFITIAPLEKGFISSDFILITETELFGPRPKLSYKHKRRATINPDAIIRNLTELNIGDPIVHIDHGIGLYQGLKTITVNDVTDEYLHLEYANHATLYVPINDLALVTRYSGAENATLNTLGSSAWEKAKQKAKERIRDVAAELLDIYAKRQSKTGIHFKKADEQYVLFSDAFPFDETPDQEKAIEQVISDMCSEKKMDRLICGDVGFGKTEVAMRAAFLAVQNNKQVAILVPTTLLAQQHYETFSNRFAHWPINIEVLSRFKTAAEQKKILEQLMLGKTDIIIGTHKLIQKGINFKQLGLLIIDEEHRFGVQQKEALKSLRAEIDILALTATPIPRTLNLALSGVRDLSIIATPPEKRLSIKTFIYERTDSIIIEAVSRELMRGGQVFFLHNKVETIERTAKALQELIPAARLSVAHGQMHERELEHIMSDFYHRRSNVLVCTTIIENGIDIPTANTIIIDRADQLGLAQLHQLRGRVGRSHHQAYAYLLIPHKKSITKEAEKRLDAIAASEELGIGFTLATHDLEIRGAGELLGEDQSGHIHEIGFDLYMSLLDQAVHALKSGKEPDLEKPFDLSIEINLGISTIIPDDYLHDVHQRLVLYKRIAHAKTSDELSDLRVEMIDRFGLLPDSVKNLFNISELKLTAKKIGIKKIQVNQKTGYIEFTEKPHIDSLKLIKLIQNEPATYQLKGPGKIAFKLKDETNPPIEFVEKTLEKIT